MPERTTTELALCEQVRLSSMGIFHRHLVKSSLELQAAWTHHGHPQQAFCVGSIIMHWHRHCLFMFSFPFCCHEVMAGVVVFFLCFRHGQSQYGCL